LNRQRNSNGTEADTFQSHNDRRKKKIKKYKERRMKETRKERKRRLKSSRAQTLLMAFTYKNLKKCDKVPIKTPEILPLTFLNKHNDCS
jgi:hypothetical protein